MFHLQIFQLFNENFHALNPLQLTIKENIKARKDIMK